MIIGLEKMDSTLLMLASDLDSLSEKYVEKIPKDERSDFRQGIDSIRREMFKMIEASKKAQEIVSKVY
ncbi:hypothetical protein J4227_07920 [Candidatus Woesearchaeota archaeon]|nr:hypothetical protein [Candidatus Woesearchaeota archaeon]